MPHLPILPVLNSAGVCAFPPLVPLPDLTEATQNLACDDLSMYVCTCVCAQYMCTYMYVCMYVCMHLYVCMYVCKYV